MKEGFCWTHPSFRILNFIGNFVSEASVGKLCTEEGGKEERASGETGLCGRVCDVTAGVEFRIQALRQNRKGISKEWGVGFGLWSSDFYTKITNASLEHYSLKGC